MKAYDYEDLVGDVTQRIQNQVGKLSKECEDR
jgi:hypothetical protein